MPRLSPSALSIRSSVFADIAPLVDAHLARGGSLVPLHIGDTHLLPPEAARLSRASSALDDAALHRYGPVAGDTLLLDACVDRLRRHGRAFAGVERRHVLVGGGATHAIFCAARAVFEPGDEVIVLSPYWPLAVGVLRAAGAVPVELPFRKRVAAEGSGRIEAVLGRALGPRTRGLYLITPNNPDGSVLSREELAALASFARTHDLWVIADEVYADYVFDGEHVSIAGLPEMAERTLTAYSFSKSHALAGARVGFVVAPEGVVSLARRIKTHSLFNVPLFSQRACQRAVACGEHWVDDARRAYRAARDRAFESLGALLPLVETENAAGGTYLFLDFTKLLRGRPLRVLLERAIARGVFLAPGDAFGDEFGLCARLCYSAVPSEVLEQGLAHLRLAVEDVA